MNFLLRVDSFCGFSLRVGTCIIFWIYLIFFMIHLLVAIYFLGKENIRNQAEHPAENYFWVQALIFSIIVALMSLVGLASISQNDKSKLKFCLFILDCNLAFVFVHALTGFFTLMEISAQSASWDRYVTMFTYDVLGFFINWFFTSVVHSYYKKTKEETKSHSAESITSEFTSAQYYKNYRQPNFPPMAPLPVVQYLPSKHNT